MNSPCSVTDADTEGHTERDAVCRKFQKRQVHRDRRWVRGGYGLWEGGEQMGGWMDGWMDGWMRRDLGSL